MADCTVGAQIWLGVAFGAIFGFVVGLLAMHAQWLRWKNKHIGWRIGKDGAAK